MATPEELFVEFHDKLVPRSFHAGFVVLSFVVSLIGSACTLELINRRTSPKGTFNQLLLVSSAVTMGGVAIWSMHYVGNRAIVLAHGEPELQIAYNKGFTALSFFVPIAVLLAAFVATGTGSTVSWWRVSMGGFLAGIAILGMHYLGNASINNYICEYHVGTVIGAAVIAVAASIVALSLFFVFRAAWNNAWWKRLVTSFVLAGAVSGMHWCAASGTQYYLVSLADDSNTSSRNGTIIVVLCLSIGACFVIAGTAVYSARVRRRYATKAQQVVLAAAVFDMRGRILVNTDGLVPSEKITDKLLGKDHGDKFTIAHPLFQWMFQASRNWSSISQLVGGMSNHLAQLPRAGKSGDAGAEVRLVDEHGDLVANHDVIFRELFCVTALSLTSRLKEELSSAGILWDEILATGIRATARRRSVAGLGDGNASDVTLKRGGSNLESAEDMAEKGLPNRLKEYGRGSLMFLVRRLQTDQEIRALEAAGFRFAEIHQVSGIIRSNMQVKTQNLDEKFRDMALYAEERSSTEPGVHLGFFGIQTHGGGAGYDVLVRKEARNLLPTVALPLKVSSNRLDGWQLECLRPLDGMTVVAICKKLESMKGGRQREHVFASQFLTTIQALQDLVDDPLFNDATLIAKPVGLPCRRSDDGPGQAMGTLIAFRLVIPIHANVVSPRCQFVPLSFFKVEQQAVRSGPHNAVFARSVHRELAPIINSLPAQGSPSQGPNAIPSKSRWGILDRLRGRGNKVPYATRPYGNPSSGTAAGRASSPSPSNRSTTTLKLWPERDSGEGSSGGALSGDAGDNAAPTYPIRNITEQRAFGGIMISQEVTIDVVDVDADRNNSDDVSPSD